MKSRELEKFLAEQMDRDVPAMRLDQSHHRPKVVEARHCAEVGDEVKPHAAKAGRVEARNLGRRRVRVEQRDAAITALEIGERIDHRGIVGAVAGGLDEHAALETEQAVQPHQRFLGGIMGREAAVERIVEFVRWAEDMEMGIAGERRQGDARRGGVRIGWRTGRLRTQAPMRFSGHGGVPLVCSVAPTLICRTSRKDNGI